jgi:F420-dependent oxidoreductase-like protein
MELGVHIVRFDWPDAPRSIAPVVSALARTSDEMGASSLSFMDHYFQIPMAGPVEDPMLEGYTALAFVAAQTQRIKLNLLVTGMTYRHPGLLIKIVTTLDVISGGRAQLGIGAAWNEREHRGLGVPFPPLAERFKRLEEALQIAQQMWSDDNRPYDGKYYQLEETICSPQPLSKPRPAVIVGGGGERKTLRLVAQYADACNLFGLPPDRIASKLDVLRRHCDDVGRDYAAIKKTMLHGSSSLMAGDGESFLREMQPYAALGIDEVVVMPSGDDPVRWLETGPAPIIGRLAELGDG